MSTSRWGERLVRYPADLADRYRQAGLWGTRTIADELHAVAVAHPQRDAVVALDGRLTYRELDERTDVLAAGLAGLGLAPGDPVLFQVTNRLGAVLAWYGVLKAGLVPVCTLAAHRGHEIGEISRRVGAVAHLVEAGTPSIDLVSFAAEQQRDHPTLRHVLVLGGTRRHRRNRDRVAGRRHGPADRPQDRRGDPARDRPRRRGGLPALRRHDRRAQGDPPAARRILVQRRSLRPLVGLVTGHPRRPPDPGHPQRRHRVRGPRPAQRRRLPGTGDRRPRCLPAADGQGASHPRPARTRALQGHRRGRRVRGRHRVGDAGDPVGHQGAASPVRRPGTTRTVVRAAIRHGRGAVPHHPSRRPPRGPGHHGRHPPVPDGRDQDPGTRHRHRAPRRRGRRAVLPRPLHAARIPGRRRAQRPGLHGRRLLPHRRPRLGPRDRRPAVRRHRGPHQGPHQPGRREDQRRGGRAAAAPPPADHRGRRRRHAGPAARGTHLRLRRGTGRTAHHGRGPAALRRAAGGEVQMARTRRASRRSPPHPGREDGQEAPAGRDRREGRSRTRRGPAASRHPCTPAVTAGGTQ